MVVRSGSPYGFCNTMLYIITYAGRIYQQSTGEAIWDVMLRSEWAFSAAIHLLYEARSGRLWWIPHQVREDIRSLSLEDPRVATGDTPSDEEERRVLNQLNSLLKQIDGLAWAKIPRDGNLKGYPDMGEEFACSGGSDPHRLNGVTPVHEGADWVIFDAERWIVHLPRDYLVPAQEDWTVVPKEHRLDRVRFYRTSVAPSTSNIGPSSRDCSQGVTPAISRNRWPAGVSPSLIAYLARNNCWNM